MVHPAIATAAASALIGSAVAFELTVFKPWRQENWPDGIKAGIQRELRRTRDDFGEAFQEIKDFANGRAPRSTMPNQRDNHDRSDRSRSRRHSRIQQNGSDSEDDYGSDSDVGRNKLDRSGISTLNDDEFEMHEREVLRQRERLREMFGDNSGNEMRNRKNAPSNTLSSQSTSQSQSQYFEPESPHHEIGTSSPTLSSQSDAELDDAISNLGSTDPFTAEGQHSNRNNSFNHERGTVLFDVEDATSQDPSPPALPPKPEAWRSDSMNSNSVWSLSDSNDGSPSHQVGNLTPKSSSSPVIPARSLSPQFQSASAGNEVAISTPTLSATSGDQDEDLDLVSPPESLANGWEQESNFSFPNSNSNNVSRDVSVDGRSENGDLVMLSPSTNGNSTNGNNPFEEAWVVDEEEEEEDRKARAQLSRFGSASETHSQSQSQATLRQISDNHSESGESWADLDEVAAVNTQGLKDSWSGSQSSLL